MKDEAKKPELHVSSFSDEKVKGYIETLEEIQQNFGNQQPILVKIASYGGSIYGFWALYEHLVLMGSPIITYTSSHAMSAGCFLLATAAKKGNRFASPNASIMLHEIQSGFGGDVKDIEDQASFLKVENDKLLKLFAKSVGLASAKDVRDMIKQNANGHDLNMTAAKAKQLGIVDHVSYLKLSPPVIGYNIIQVTKKV